jgi:type IV secretory pathway TraG/TraD family ATPase VirD4
MPSAFAPIGIAIGMSVWRAREAKTITTYGSARWATASEVRAAGLLGPDGVVLGRFDRDYLRHDGPGRGSPPLNQCQQTPIFDGFCTPKSINCFCI